MTLLFDATTGRLRLDAASFDALCGWAATGTGRSPVLEGAGLLTGDEPHPILASLAAALTDSSSEVAAKLTTAEGTEHADAWFGPETTALLLDLPGEPPGRVRELVTLDSRFLPAALARFFRMGPRPVPYGEPRQADPEQLASLFATDTATTTITALAELAPAALWTVTVIHGDADGQAEAELLQALDTPGGLWLLEAANRDTLTLTPINTAGVWRTLLRRLSG